MLASKSARALLIWLCVLATLPQGSRRSIVNGQRSSTAWAQKWRLWRVFSALARFHVGNRDVMSPGNHYLTNDGAIMRMFTDHVGSSVFILTP